MEVDEHVSMGRDILLPRDSLTLVDAQLATLFGEDVTAAELLREQQEPGHPSTSSEGIWCPVHGCSRAQGRVGIGFSSQQALRAHVDLHLAAELPGLPSDAWLTAHVLKRCRHCGLSLSQKIRDDVHPRCRGKQLSCSAPLVARGRDSCDVSQLPTLQDVFLCNVLTKEFLPLSLVPLIREEYGKLLSRVVQTNRSDAWDTQSDCVEK